MTPFECYRVCLALRLHFVDKKYDYFQYNGMVKLNEETFNKKREKFRFAKLAKKFEEADFVEFCVSNFVGHDINQVIKNLGDGESLKIYERWKTNCQKLSEIVFRESQWIRQTFDSDKLQNLTRAVGGTHPLLLVCFYSENISLETLVVYNRLFSFIDEWDQTVNDQIMWPDTSLMIRKYTPFIKIDEELYLQRVTGGLGVDL